jgi:hypothetical protein
MTSKIKRSITSVKIPDALYEDFKIAAVRTKMNLQELTERTMYLYLTDGDFRMKIHKTYSTYYTGSQIIEAIK